MPVLVVGLSHKTVPLELLERVAVPKARLPKALADLAGRDFLSEAVTLSTCHRTEVYAVADRFHGAVQDVRHFLSEHSFAPPEDLTDHLYTYHDDAAIEHLFKVTAGIDSVLIGESQILGQVRNAWEVARAEGAAGRQLGDLFRHALEVGKRARTDTGISRGITSLSQAALAMVKGRMGSLEGRRIIVVGTGEVGEGMVTDLAAASEASEVLIANRTRDRAEKLAARVGGQAIDLESLPGALDDADVVFASSGAASLVLSTSDLRARSGGTCRPLLVVDLGMPRNVEGAVGAVEGVTLLDLDDLRAFVDAGLDQRRREVNRVRAIVAEEVARFVTEASARQVSPTITALRAWAEDVRTAEIERNRARLASLDADQREAVEGLTRSLVAKLLHQPTVRLKESAGSGQGDRLTAAVGDLFDVDRPLDPLDPLPAGELDPSSEG